MENKMREIRLEKVILNIGGTSEKLEKGVILLQKISGKKAIKVKATKRIPTWSVRPGLEVGTKVTLRGKEAMEILKKLLPAIDNTLKERQIQDNFFSFGIHEYIEIPGMEYIREVGIMGFEVTGVFSRAGKSVEMKKIKRGKAKRLVVTQKEIEDYLIDKFGTEILRKKIQGEEDDSE
ncbi:MAG: 50S ribosomal protein L5 [archaeon]|nr:50S ribosomal protein L5 [archaeon]MCR4323954.1 50S ribosomal protein L5 [Nanoarchaeota archaeon]